ncbi:hypothetical protein ACIQC5_01765 [Paenarthrobacter sp. NPDC092416]|uniref:hypothetical protein n=1 Tax=Paenarthrobacter sp. NPDC092416 TaxID=3364386 RepID=UPI0038090D51
MASPVPTPVPVQVPMRVQVVVQAEAQERIERWKIATWLVVVVAFWLAMAEVDRLIGGFIVSGERRNIADVVGVAAFDRRDSWELWSGLDVEDGPRLATLIRWHVVLDLGFAASYVWLLWRLVRPYWKIGLVAGVLGLAELIEAALLFLGAAAVWDHETGWVATSLAVVATIKWLTFVFFLICCLAFPAVRSRIGQAAWRIVRTLHFQRFSAAVIAVIAVLALLPIPGVNDQMPDSQRLWAVEGLLSASWWSTVFAVVLVTLGLFVLGRRRSDLAWKLWVLGKVPENMPSRWWWMIGPLAILMGSLWVAPNGQLSWFQLVLFIGPPLVLVLISLRIRHNLTRKGDSIPLPRVDEDRTRALDAWCGGDNLAVALLAVSGLASVRSFTGPVAKHFIQPGATPIGWAVFFLIFGSLLAVAVYPVKAWLVRRITDRAISGSGRRRMADLLKPSVGSPAFFRKLLLLFFVLAVLFLAFLAMIPGPVTKTIGVSATAVGGVGAWALVIGYLVVLVQDQRPLEIFQLMGFTANPLLTLLVAVIAIGQLNGGNAQVHALHQVTQEKPGSVREDIQKRFAAWLEESTPCERASGVTGKTVRPMLLVASEGGGIRAASWTARVFAQIVDADTNAGIRCGGVASFASSGVSGGSLGLTLVNLYDSSPEIVRAVDEVAAPDALAAGVAGAIVGDLVAEGAGVMMPTDQGDGWKWHDRAGLMETIWEGQADKLGGAFDVSERGPAGALILNSTATGSGCRLVVSQLDLVTATADPRKPGCGEPEGQPVTIDLLKSGHFCNTQFNWSTAVGLSARFPIISPAGRVFYPGDSESGQPAGCPDNVAAAPSLQAIDGGYAEVSGLGTVSDLWWELGALVAEHNRNVEAALPLPAPAPDHQPVTDAEKAKASFVVPIFVYIRNSPGSDVAPAIPKPAAEIVVPLAGVKAKDAQSDAAAWKQRLQEGAGVCALASTQCSGATAALAGELGETRVVEVAPNSEPAIDPPLGWTLSAFSIERLDTAMGTETVPCGSPNKGCSDFRKLLDILAR